MAHYKYCQTHLNGNLLCAIDCETTGLRFNNHDILQICVLPLGIDLRPSKHIQYFHCLMKPRRPENIDEEASRVNRNKVVEALNHGMEPETAEERLREWFHSLKLPLNKKIVPLGHNYCFDRDFIIDWLGGPLSYEEFFRSDHRDSMSLALMINDMAAWAEEKIPFPKVGLSYIANILQVEYHNAHDAITDCMMTADVYRKLLRWKDHYHPGPLPPSLVGSPVEEKPVE